jgi:hypothetical protein
MLVARTYFIPDRLTRQDTTADRVQVVHRRACNGEGRNSPVDSPSHPGVQHQAAVGRAQSRGWAVNHPDLTLAVNAIVQFGGP